MAEVKSKPVDMLRWKVIGASTRGASHLRSGLPNQDACDHWLAANRNAAILAVSDGHGSSRHFRSQTGSKLAVEAAIRLLREFMGQQGSHFPEEPAVRDLPRRIVERWLANVATHFAENPFTEAELKHLTEEDSRAPETVTANPAIAYGATLLATAAMQEWVLHLQLGDGDILTVNDAGDTTRPLPEDSRLVGNQTTSLCQPEAWNEFRIRLMQDAAQPPALVLLSTDGYANSFRSEEDFLLIGRDYLAMARERGLEKVEQELPGILEEASKQGSGDDITLGILQRENKGSSAGLAGAPSGKTQALEQLQKDYVVQQQKLSVLESSHRHASKTLHRMQWLLALIAVCVGAYLVAHYWKPWEGVTPPVIQGKKDKQPVTGALSIPHPWTLSIGSGEIDLTAKTKLTAKEIGLSKDKDGKDKDKDSPVAEVVKTKDGLGLKNVSTQEWTVTPAGGKADKKSAKGIVPLQDGTKIDFGGGVSGTIYSGHNLQTLQSPGAR
jgi:protein phosphatase 2C-like protein